MKLEQLDLKEWILLARRAEDALAPWLRRWAQQLYARQTSRLPQLYRRSDARRRCRRALAELDASTPWPRVWHLDESKIDAHLKLQFPSIADPFSESAGPPLRDLRDAEDELTHYYSSVTECAAEDTAEQFEQLARWSAPEGYRRSA